MDHNDIKIIEKDLSFQGYFRINTYYVKHRKFDGGWTEVFSREIFERGHAVAILPYDPIRDEIVLIEQFRAGALAANRINPWLIEIAAGIIDKGDTAEQAAYRELREETGCTVKNLTFCSDYLTTPGGSSETICLYIGEVDARDADGIHGLDDEHEDIRVFKVSREKALEMVDQGQVDNAVTMLAILWLDRHREKIISDWKNQTPA